MLRELIENSRCGIAHPANTLEPSAFAATQASGVWS
jgi:hypothetical protein